MKPYTRLGHFGVRFLTSVAGHSSCPAVLSHLAGTQHTKSRKHRKDSSYKGNAIGYDQFLSTRHYHERKTDEKNCFSVLFLAYHSTPNSLFLIIFPFLPPLGLFSGLSCSTQRHIACYSPSSLHPSLDLTFTAWSQHSSPVCPPILRSSSVRPTAAKTHPAPPLHNASSPNDRPRLHALQPTRLTIPAYPPVCPPALPPQHFPPLQAKKWATDRFKM